MILPGPKRDYALTLNLNLVEKLEKQAGLIDVAERLTAGALSADQVFSSLKTAYQAAGCLLPQETLRRFLTEKNPETILAELLLGLLSPLLAMKAVPLGERLGS